MSALPMCLHYGVKIKSSDERKKENSHYIGGNVYDAYPAPVCCVAVFLCIGLGWLARVFPPASFVLGILMKSGDCDVRAAACRALGLALWPCSFSIRALEYCIYDPSGDVERAVSYSLNTLGPKYISLNAYLTLLLSERVDSVEVGKMLAKSELQGERGLILSQLDVLLEIGDQLSSDDPFLEAFLEELAPSAHFNVWEAIEKLAQSVRPDDPDAMQGRDHYKIRRRQLFALRSLRAALLRFKGNPDYVEKFIQLKNELSLYCLAETNEQVMNELSLVLELLS